MFQLKVPTWGSTTSSSAFEVVAASPATQSKKRPAPTASSSKVSDSSPKPKKSKQKEVDSSAQHQSSAPKGHTKPTAAQSKSSTNSKTSSSSHTSKTVVPTNPSATTGAVKHAPKHTPAKESIKQQRKDFGAKTDKSPKMPQKKESRDKKSGKKTNSKNKKVNAGSDSEDSLDELFGSYGGSESEFSYTSGEDDLDIVIRSPNESRESVSSESEGEESEGEPMMKKGEEYSSEGFSSEDDEHASSYAAPSAGTKLSALQEQMKAKLEGGRFRFINQKLYTTTGDEAFDLFQKEPVLFDVYHQGYRNQVEKWPQNPLDLIIAYLKKQPASLVVVDFGCGEARLAQTVPQKTVHSFDLVARNKFITACDIAHVPLKASVADVAVFCLSLMGNNVSDFLREAYRVLKPNGVLKIAEVKSRFEKINTFTDALEKIGFDIKKRDDGNKMFILFDCVKSDRKPAKEVEVKLKPCIYKRR